jgi:hypothetical protein
MEETEALVAASKEIGLELTTDKLSILSCINIKMQEEITV